MSTGGESLRDIIDEQTGGPAFPQYDALTAGMSLRQYYAAKAMEGALMNADLYRSIITVSETDGVSGSDGLALYAFRVADSMLKAGVA